MLLGMLRPRWPWRWVLMVGVFIPLTELAAYLILTVKPTRAQVYGSFLAFLPGIAGAYGGSVMRRVMDTLSKENSRFPHIKQFCSSLASPGPSCISLS